MDTTEYLRRIHFWVRLWSLLSVAGFVIFLAVTLLGGAVQNEFDATYTGCLQRGGSADTCDWLYSR